MRMLGLVAGACLIAMPAAAQDGDRDFYTDAMERDERPVACIAQRMAGDGDPESVAAVVRSGFAAEGNSQQAALDRIGGAVNGCKRTNGWSDARADAALNFFRGAVLRGDAAYQLRAYGVETDHFAAGAAAMPAEARVTMLEQGVVTGSAMTAAAAAIEAAGADFSGLSADQQRALITPLGQGIAGSLMVDGAIESYSALSIRRGAFPLSGHKRRSRCVQHATASEKRNRE